jgi:hypothetical protein
MSFAAGWAYAVLTRCRRRKNKKEATPPKPKPINLHDVRRSLEHMLGQEVLLEMSWDKDKFSFVCK